jgi:ubiquinone/menaquinone biosynthesis C-methylase UbiE
MSVTALIRRPLETVEDNFRRPTGRAGRLLGRLMALQHRTLTVWTIDHMGVGSADHVLDVGCGGGMAIELLSRRTIQGRIAGLDYSPEMVAQATARNAKAIARGSVEVREGDAMALPYADETFDHVCAIETYYFWPDALLGLREAHRVLRPGGQLAVTLEMSREASAQTSPLRRRMSERYARRAAAVGQRICSGAELTQLMTEAGFQEARYVAEPDRSLGWLCALARKQPPRPETSADDDRNRQ